MWQMLWTFGNQTRQGFDSVLIQDSVANQYLYMAYLKIYMSHETQLDLNECL